MTVRPPSNQTGHSITDMLAASFEAELRQERASELGRTSRRVEKTLAALAALGSDADPAERAALIDDAADAVYLYFIQREVSGYRSHRDAIEFYGIPPQVLARLGVVRPSR